MRTEDIKTEVFFLPAAAHTEKDGSFTNTQRLLQWHHTAVEPAGDARSELWFTYHLGLRIRRSWPPHSPRRRPRRTGRSWISPGLPGQGAAGRARRGGRARRDQRVGFRRQIAIDLHPAQGRRLHVLWLLDLRRRVRRRGEPGRPSRARRAAELDRQRVGLGLAGEPAGAVQPCLGRPGRPALERTQGPRLVGRRKQPLDRTRRARLHRRPAAGLHPARRGDRRGRDHRHGPVHHAGRRQGVAVRPGWHGRRADARATTSRRSPRSPTCSTASSTTRSGRSSRARRACTSRAETSRDQRCSRTSPPPTG